MVAFGIETERSKKALLFMHQTRERLKSNNVAENPFIGTVVHKPQLKEDKYYFLISMVPLWPKFYYTGLFFIIPSLVFRGLVFNGWVLAGMGLLACGFFWSKRFLYLMLFLGLRKAGYLEKVKLIKDNTMLELLVYDTI